MRRLEPVASYIVEASSDEPTLQVTVPALESRSGWFASARSEGWWSSTEYIPSDAREVSLTLVPEGVVRFAIDGTDRGVDLLETGQVWIGGRVGSRGVRLDRRTYGGPCEVDREPDRREVLIACPFARDETVDLRVRLGLFLPLLRSEVTVTADTGLGLIEPVRGAVVTGSVASADGSSHQLALIQRHAPLAFGWSGWTDSGGVFVFEGLAPGAYELRIRASDGDSWPARIESLSDHIDLGPLVSAAGNLLAVSLVSPSTFEIGGLKPTVVAAALGPDGDVEARGQRFEAEEQGTDGAFFWRGLPAGDYEVWVEDNRGNRWHREVVHFFGHDRFYVELDAVPLVGRIARGGEPLENVMVWFGGLYGADRVSFRSREEGRFSGLLPREGDWPVAVTPAPACDPCEGDWNTNDWEGFDSHVVDSFGFFEIEADSDGVARVRLDIPAAGVGGRVVRVDLVNGTVEPVADARVRVSAVLEADGEQRAPELPSSWLRRTDALGRFEITGLTEGEYRATAEAWLDERVLESLLQRFRVAGNDPIEDLELRLNDQRRVTIVVRAGGVPVAGAQTFILHPAGTTRVRSNGTTRGAGTVPHWLPMEAEVVDVVVRAEGFGMSGWRFDVSDGAPIEIEMSPDRGSLRVPNERNAWLATPVGASIRMSSLVATDNKGRVRRDGDEYVVTDLAPGTYSYCTEDGACSTVDVVPWAESRVRE